MYNENDPLTFLSLIQRIAKQKTNIVQVEDVEKEELQQKLSC